MYNWKCGIIYSNLSFNGENFDSNPLILVTNSKIKSKTVDIEYRYGYIEHMALLILSKDNGAILSQTIIANNGESKSFHDGIKYYSDNY